MALTEAQQKDIKVRQRLIRRRLHGFFQRDPRYGICLAGRSRRSLGGATRNRLMGFAKMGAFEAGRLLATHWTAIEPELNRDPYVLGARVLADAALSRFVAADWESRFYTMAEGATDSIDAGMMVPQRVADMDAFTGVSDEQAEIFLGYWGGGTLASVAKRPAPDDAGGPAGGPDRKKKHEGARAMGDIERREVERLERIIAKQLATRDTEHEDIEDIKSELFVVTDSLSDLQAKVVATTRRRGELESKLNAAERNLRRTKITVQQLSIELEHARKLARREDVLVGALPVPVVVTYFPKGKFGIRRPCLSPSLDAAETPGVMEKFEYDIEVFDGESRRDHEYAQGSREFPAAWMFAPRLDFRSGDTVRVRARGVGVKPDSWQPVHGPWSDWVSKVIE